VTASSMRSDKCPGVHGGGEGRKCVRRGVIGRGMTTAT
jgi:hypothetical protein